jgi:hypothetical protein
VSWKNIYRNPKIIPKQKVSGSSKAVTEPKFNHIYNLNEKLLYTSYIMRPPRWFLCVNPFSDYMQNAYGRIEVENASLKIHFSIYTTSA